MPAAMAEAEDLDCLQTEVNRTVQPVSWYSVLQEQARAAFVRRSEKFEQLKTHDQIRSYQQAMRAFLLEQLGGFPERSALHAQVVGTIQCQSFRIEKIIFESQPQHHLTGNLYIPDGQGPYPGVLVSSGHSRAAKASDYNQRLGILLAQYGIVAFCYDPIGQGERSQVVTVDGKPAFEGTTTEHFMVGAGSILVGRNTATYRIWDAMRAIDYLQTRSDIDPQRIGMTGCSGGGTLTSYVMALDERVVCAAPACYLTTMQRLLDSIGPQDSEQNIFGQVASGLDHPDYVLLRAPKPTLISATTDDFFDIAGTWDTFRQAKRIYTRLGASERVDLVEAEGKHGVQPENLAAIVQWMCRWLKGTDVMVPVPDFAQFDIRSEAELLCTDEGQVLQLPGERSVYDLNAELAESLAVKRRALRGASDRQELMSEVCRIAGIRPLAVQVKPASNKAGKVQRDGYHIDKLVMHSDSSVPLPALTYHPQDPADSAYLYLHDGGKAADGAVGGPIEKIVKEGYVVVSVDLRGQGETSSGTLDGQLGDWKSFYLAYLLGQSTVGGQTEDILAAGQWVANYQSKQPREVHLIAVGRTGVAALHAAAMNPELFTSVTLRDAPHSWSIIPGSSAEARWLTTTVHGALRAYDLPDLIDSMPAGKVRLEP